MQIAHAFGQDQERQQDQRGASRTMLARGGTARDVHQQPVDVTIKDLSASGCMIQSEVPLRLNRILNLGIPGVGRREGRVIWETADRFGVEFLWPLSAGELAGVSTADSLVHGGFPQTLETLYRPDVAPGPARVPPSARSLAIITAASALLWLALYDGIAHLIA